MSRLRNCRSSTGTTIRLGGARDVREEGVPLVTFRVKNAQGRSIGAYRFGDPSLVRHDRVGGRRAFPKVFKKTLVQRQGEVCAVCCETFQPRELQVDHRVPYTVSGDAATEERDPADYMLLCGSCNRAKSWSCEHCANSLEMKQAKVCRECYWANPRQHKHVALRQLRRLDVTWSDSEVEEYERLRRLANKQRTKLPQYVKDLLRRCLGEAGQS